MGDFIPSIYQQAVFDEVRNGTSSIIINAVAGSGKSTTIKKCYHSLPPGSRKIMLAFNKIIADELKNDGIMAKTLNSAGFGSIMRNGLNGMKPVVDTDKVGNIMTTCLTKGQMKKYGSAVYKMVSWAKGLGIVPNHPYVSKLPVMGLTRDTDDEWYRIIDAAEISFEITDNDGDYDHQAAQSAETEAIRLAREVLARSVSDTTLIDLDDQKYMTVIYDVPCFQNDVVFLDEAQDLNRIDRALVKKMLKTNGRLIAVGDRNQAIYGWRGADTQSMDRIKEEFNCKELPLSICYRCPNSVVRMAQQWVPHIEPRENAPAGTISQMTRWTPMTFKPHDLVLCRNNAPIISLAFSLLANDVPVRLAGRDFGKGIITLLSKFRDGFQKCDPAVIEEHENYETENCSVEMVYLGYELAMWRDRETEKARARDNASRADRVNDMFQTISIFMDRTDGSTIQDLIREVEALFSRTAKDGVLLSTIHRAKGGEGERVYILDWWLCPSKYARTPDAQQQEINLMYVAVTRSLSELYFIDTDGYENDR